MHASGSISAYNIRQNIFRSWMVTIESKPPPVIYIYMYVWKVSNNLLRPK